MNDVNIWTTKNKLKLNHEKTVVQLFRSPKQGTVPEITELTIAGINIGRSKAARNLGAVFDEHLTMADHIIIIIN